MDSGTHTHMYRSQLLRAHSSGRTIESTTFKAAPHEDDDDDDKSDKVVRLNSIFNRIEDEPE